jgi:SAM-dependent methyltransferase
MPSIRRRCKTWLRSHLSTATKAAAAAHEGYLDYPAATATVHGLGSVSGWALTPGGEEWTIEVLVDGAPAEVTARQRTVRPDVARAFPHAADYGPLGFEESVNWLRYPNGQHTVECFARGPKRRFSIGKAVVNVANGAQDEFYQRISTRLDDAARDSKLSLVLQVLACPECRAAFERTSENQLRCCGCRHTYPMLDRSPVLLPGTPEHAIDERALDSPASNNPYPEIVLSALERVSKADGLTLDIGAGRRGYGAGRLVQLEICKYPFTDVVSQFEELPFADDSFDLVFSLAVTEHVKKPWVLAAEMQRVTKPGGEIIVDSAFLQPIHGYPNHYFNMTDVALRDLFARTEVLSLVTAPYQTPWFALRWILNSLMRDLNGDTARIFQRMTVSELLHEGNLLCNGLPSKLHAIPLSETTVRKAAAGFTLHCRKRQ